MAGLGFRREMTDWDMSAVQADFFEVVAENWVRRDRTPLYQFIESGRPVYLHGVSLNLGGFAPLNRDFLREIKALIADLNCPHYSDHLAASGDAHQLYDLFPVPFTLPEARRIAERIRCAQDILGQRMAIENSTWYANTGDMPELEFINTVLDLADCDMVLDLNNIDVNYKNHGGYGLSQFVAGLDMRRVRYMHVAGHEWDERFELFIDTHSQSVPPDTVAMAQRLHQQQGLPILLEWDNDIPTLEIINRELECLKRTPMRFTTM